MKSPSRVAVRYVAWLTPRAAMILLASLLVALLSGLSLLRLEFDVGLVSMLPKGSARFADYERFVERFGSRDLVVALVRGPDREETTRFASALAGALAEQSGIEKVRGRVDREALLRALGEGGLPRLLPIDRHDEIERRLGRENIADTVAGMKAALALPGSFGLSSFLTVDPLGLSGVWGEALASSRPDRALDPGQDWLASADGRRVLLLIQPQESGYGLAEVEALARTLQDAESAVRERLGSNLETRVAYTGVFAHTLEDARLLERDITLYVVLALIGVLAVFYAGFRDLRILPFVTYHLALTTLVALAMGILLLGRLNLMSLAFAAIFYGLGIDAAIHFYTRFLEERAKGTDGQGALARTLTALFWPTLLATATTAVAFGVIGFSSLRGVAQLGVLTALGLLVNVPATFVVMAALLSWLDARGRLGRLRSPARSVWLAGVARFIVTHRRAGLFTSGILLAVLAVGAGRSSIDADLFHLRPQYSEARSVEAEIQREFGFTDPQDPS